MYALTVILNVTEMIFKSIAIEDHFTSGERYVPILGTWFEKGELLKSYSLLPIMHLLAVIA
jgi:hypothetical protein